MLKDFQFGRPMLKDVYKQKINMLNSKLASLQQTIKEKKLPVVIIFEGPSAAGKGECISRTILSLDPRFFKTYSIATPNDVERRMPWLWRYWVKLPKEGQICFFDRSWYQDVINKYVERKGVTRSWVENKLKSIYQFERQLTDNGYLVIKFYVHITKQEQKERLTKLASKQSTQWRVTKRDWARNKNYDKHLKEADKMLELTDFEFAPWHIVDGMDKKTRAVTISQTIVDSIENAVSKKQSGSLYSPSNKDLSGGFGLIERPKLSEIDLSKTIDDTLYKELLDKYQKRLLKLQNKFYLYKIPVVVVFEGWDAAGKGGCIKRTAAGLDARSYQVNPISSPTPDELSHHYLWRFYNTLPKDGHFAIYDRSWYGRVMVEHIENIIDENTYNRAFREINEFEDELINWGAVIVKFWIHIDKQTQLLRFKERENTPAKRWKITDEDYRNREKWDRYETDVNKMIELTSTVNAPWYIIEADDKHYARIRVLKTLESALTQKLKSEQHRFT